MQLKRTLLMKQIQFLNWLIDKLEHSKEHRYLKIDDLED